MLQERKFDSEVFSNLLTCAGQILKDLNYPKIPKI